MSRRSMWRHARAARPCGREGKSGVGIGIVGQAQSNTVQISDGVQKAVAELQASLPQGVNITISSDDAAFIRSVHRGGWSVR